MYDLELVFLTSKKRIKKLYFFNIKRDIPEEYITALMNKMCYMLDFCLFDVETIEPKTYKFISKQIRSFNMSF